ncbi:hypothetical protein GWK36_12110 [Caldichromatium japonicum]|uniref:Glycosyltransferase RgtA/B/C/D-like domain-containing protein n=1 Tax=Caldichromatium japonicum TaxID=2699430 RepID=A0A6G7VF02_9GAMM|nr:hypothetical protein [Caldichromatium japonicum]QIK38601.1 hypothetical protein GWK36_12110 [Caldichromatium japonicum]
MSLSWLAVGLMLLLPWILASLWLRTLWCKCDPGVLPLVIGYGFMLAMFGVSLVLFITGLIGMRPAIWPVMVILVLVALGSWGRLRTWFSLRQRSDDRPSAKPTIWSNILWAVLIVYLIVRFVALGIDLVLQPIIAWDAWTTWIFRTKAWAETGQFVEFISLDAWLADQTGSNNYPLLAADYPLGVSLIALWPVLAYGEWNETAASLPWMACAIAIGFGFYGQARLWGISPIEALFFTYILFSLPLLNIHIALPGYADIWLAAGLSLSAIAFFQWARTGDKRQLMLWLALALACLMFKREAAAWIMLFIPAMIVARLSKPWQIRLVSVVLLFLLVNFLIGVIKIDMPFIGAFSLTPSLIEAPWIGRFELNYYNNWPAVWRHLFVYDNWHLLAYLLLFAVIAVFVRMFRLGVPSYFKAQIVFVLGSLVLLYVLFFLTGAHLWAEKATSINRLILHFVPVYVFYIMTSWHLYWQPSNDVGLNFSGESCKTGE